MGEWRSKASGPILVAVGAHCNIVAFRSAKVRVRGAKGDTPAACFIRNESMSRVRFLMIGGILAAGKSTALARLARHFMEQGLAVGLVTNDQANDLVDTESLRAQGFNVGEVTGACFCCKFNGLLDTVSQLSQDRKPDIILAEPVGSCTDLVSTVI